MKTENDTTFPLSIGWTTTETRDQAEALATACVEQKRVACAQISGPITSVFYWKGKACREEEWKLTLKFLTSRTDAVAQCIRENHPYEVPQWVAVEAASALPDYARWAAEQTE